jgi:predicted HTH transcriptional regulator
MIAMSISKIMKPKNNWKYWHDFAAKTASENVPLGDLFRPNIIDRVIEEQYPHAPGFKRDGTSKLAAEESKPEASYLRAACLDCIRRDPATADEVAEWLGRSVLAVRPRLSELVAQGKIEETGKRRRNASGKLAAVWRVKI